MFGNYKIILADNQDITRAGLLNFISIVMPGWSAVEVANKQDLIKEMDKARKGVVVLDYTLFDINSIEELLILHNRFPNFSWVMFSAELSEDFIRRMSVEDNVSIVLKENSGEEIRSALVAASKGEQFLCHQISGMLERALNHHATIEIHSKELEAPLTHTEIEILKLIAKGLSVKEMAAERFSSTHTIITHKKNIFRKIGVNNVYEATRYALRAGLVEMVEYYI